MQFIQRLNDVLATLPLGDGGTAQVVNPDSPRCVLWIVSPSFEGVDEVDRQKMVWEHLRKVFSLEELERVEYIFTDAPSERQVAT